MASKQQIAKEFQGYVAKPVPHTCVNCKHYTSEITVVEHRWGSYENETDIRCGIGGFAIKKTATCKLFEGKE